MQIFRDLNSIHLSEPTVLTIGTFDGIHRGHQALLKQLQATAQNKNAQTAVITFHPRPKTVLAPHLAQNDYLTTAAERIALFKKLGLDVLINTPFSLSVAQLSAHNFIKWVTDHMNLIELWAGHDFSLGKNREGNLQTLTKLGREFNYSVKEVKPFLLDGKIVSSTQIRQALQNGQITEATHLLGRYPDITGEVVAGLQRERSIGFPTTNLVVPVERLIPANGVYATLVQWAGQNPPQPLPSVTNVGVRPSFEGDNRTIETHILNFNQDLYGKIVTLQFVKRLRPEKKFNSVDALAAQISLDAQQAKALLAKN